MYNYLVQKCNKRYRIPRGNKKMDNSETKETLSTRHSKKAKIKHNTNN